MSASVAIASRFENDLAVLEDLDPFRQTGAVPQGDFGSFFQ